MKSDLKQASVGGLPAFLVTLTFGDGTSRELPVFADNQHAALTLAEVEMDRHGAVEALIEPCISLTEDSHATD